MAHLGEVSSSRRIKTQMVLTDREIQAALQNGQIIIEPQPGETAYSSTSLDLRLSNKAREWKSVTVTGVDQIICPATKGYSFNSLGVCRNETGNLAR
jgi:hypothetical protein